MMDGKLKPDIGIGGKSKADGRVKIDGGIKSDAKDISGLTDRLVDNEIIDRLDVVYADNHVIVAVKPPNVLSQGDDTEDVAMTDIVKAWIRKKYDKQGNVYLGLVHRLDRPVGGLMVFARTSKGASRISDSIRRGKLSKTYLAVVEGVTEPKGTMIDYLKKDKRQNKVYVTKKGDKDSKRAELSYERVSTAEVSGKKYSLVKIDLHTGRSHQIRVQFSSRGHALFADHRYNISDGYARGKDQIALWSYGLGFAHPTRGEYMEFHRVPDEVFPWSEFDLSGSRK